MHLGNWPDGVALDQFYDAPVIVTAVYLSADLGYALRFARDFHHLPAF